MQTNTKRERIALNRNSRKEMMHEAPSKKQMNPTMNGVKVLMQFSMRKIFFEEDASLTQRKLLSWLNTLKKAIKVETVEAKRRIP